MPPNVPRWSPPEATSKPAADRDPVVTAVTVTVGVIVGLTFLIATAIAQAPRDGGNLGRTPDCRDRRRQCWALCRPIDCCQTVCVRAVWPSAACVSPIRASVVASPY
jgi:hypothetical protein